VYSNVCSLYNRFSEQTTDSFETNGGTNPAYTFLTGHGGYLQCVRILPSFVVPQVSSSSPQVLDAWFHRLQVKNQHVLP
jgi:hypothetical protein